MDKRRGIASYNSLLRVLINDFIKEELKAAGNNELVPSHGTLLSLVYKNGGKVQIKVIYETLQKQKSTVTEMIKRLVRLGYLTKMTCCEDKRVTYVLATDKALAFQKDFENISVKLIDKFFQGFEEEEIEIFMRLMFKAIDNFK